MTLLVKHIDKDHCLTICHGTIQWKGFFKRREALSQRISTSNRLCTVTNTYNMNLTLVLVHYATMCMYMYIHVHNVYDTVKVLRWCAWYIQCTCTFCMCTDVMWWHVCERHIHDDVYMCPSLYLYIYIHTYTHIHVHVCVYQRVGRLSM